MKTIIKMAFIGIMGSFILFSGCYKLDPVHGIKGYGPLVAETRNVKNFNGLELDVDAQVNVTIGPVISFEVIGQQNILDVLNVKVINGLLVIDYNESVWFHKRLQIDITVPDLSFISSFGSGDIYVHSPLVTDELYLDVFGSGNIKLVALSSPFVDSEIKGSGEIKLDGVVQSQQINISGSGNYKAMDLMSENTSITIFGSGNCDVLVTNSLDVSIHGSGNVYYKGEPNQRNFSVFGSGKVISVQ